MPSEMSSEYGRRARGTCRADRPPPRPTSRTGGRSGRLQGRRAQRWDHLVGAEGDDLLLVDLDPVGAVVGDVHAALVVDPNRLRAAEALLLLEVGHVAQPVRARV